jgi:hypothetical protein
LSAGAQQLSGHGSGLQYAPAASILREARSPSVPVERRAAGYVPRRRLAVYET